MKRPLSAILAALMLAAVFTACESEKPAETPTEPASLSTETDTAAEPSAASKPEEITPKDLPAPSDELPSSVDLRNFNGKSYVTPVKRQAFGDCWSFGIAAAAESSWLYVNDLGAAAGEDNTNANFSERYLSWFVYNSITEDDVKAGSVRASQVGEGYDIKEAVEKNPKTPFILGGALLSGSNVYASGFGPVDESTEKNGIYPYAYSDKNVVDPEDYEDYSPSGDWSIPINAEYRTPAPAAVLRNGNILPCPAARDAQGNYSYSEEGVNAIRSELAKGHAVAVTALVYGRMNYDNWAAYTPADEANHVITIVGYDDNYPKENFAKADSDGNIDEDTIPPTDGAFIIKDSNGENGGFDAKGSFYISYHDHTFVDPISFEFDKADTVKYNEVNYDQYDLLLAGFCSKNEYDAETKMANVFDAEEDEYLTQLVYRTKALNTFVHYEIYKAPQDGSPDSGTLLEEGDSAHYFGGSHRIDLKNEYLLNKGDKYSVVLTMKYTGEDGTDKYTEVIPYAASIIPYGAPKDNVIAVKGVINKGESFLYKDGKWTDETELVSGLVKTAFEEHSSKLLADTMKPETEDGIAVDNYPIKAILVPADKH